MRVKKISYLQNGNYSYQSTEDQSLELELCPSHLEREMDQRRWLIAQLQLDQLEH
jgi:hypothetical protein